MRVLCYVVITSHDPFSTSTSFYTASCPYDDRLQRANVYLYLQNECVYLGKTASAGMCLRNLLATSSSTMASAVSNAGCTSPASSAACMRATCSVIISAVTKKITINCIVPICKRAMWPTYWSLTNRVVLNYWSLKLVIWQAYFQSYGDALLMFFISKWL